MDVTSPLMMKKSVDEVDAFAVRVVGEEAVRRGDCCLTSDLFFCWYRHALRQRLNANEDRVVANENVCCVLEHRENDRDLSQGNPHRGPGVVNELPGRFAHTVHLWTRNFHPWSVAATPHHYQCSVPYSLAAAMLQ